MRRLASRETRRKHRAMLCLWPLAWLLGCWCATAQSGMRSQSLTEMYHTAWTVREGAPNNIISSAQTADGSLWFGGDDGLFRFDGKSFERYHPTSGDELRRDVVWFLKATPDGGLWIGYPSTGVSFLKNGHNTNFGARQGLTSGSIAGFAVDHDGTVWARSSAGLLRFDGARWRMVGADWNYDGSPSQSLYVDRRGTVWVGTGKQLLFLPAGKHAFQLAQTLTDDSYAMTEAPNGSLWIALFQSSIVKELAAPDGSLVRHPRLFRYKCDTPYFSQDGSLWLPAYGDGVYRLSSPRSRDVDAPGWPERVEHYTEQNGLTSNLAYAPMEDREGSVWIISAKGIDQFRPAALTNIPVPPDSNRIAMAPDGAGGLVAASTSALSVSPEGVPSPVSSPKHVTCAYRDPQGTIWLGGDDGLWRSSRKGFVPVALPRETDPAFHTIQTMTMDRTGGLWVSFIHTGFLRFDGAGWTHPANLSASARDPGNVSLTDGKGRLWFGLRRNRVEVLDGTTVTRYSVDSGLDIDSVAAIYEHGGQIWVGGELGLEFLKGARFQHLLLADGTALEGVSGIVQTANGDLWLNQASGIVHIAGDEVRHAQADPQYGAYFTLYNYLDGLVNSAHQVRPSPTAIETGDGKIYFATRAGLAWIDPAHIPSNAVPPPVSLRSIIADGRVFPDAGDLQLPVHTRVLEIDYTAASFLIPQRVRFRYKLEGFDRDWQDAGTRRQAFYAGLPPGHYTFRVRASNNDGLWSETASSASLYVPPSFLQSGGFKLLCGTAAFTLLALLYRMRVQLITNRVKTRLYERLSERERIARDLHDTFFQGIQGLLLRFNTATSQLKQDEPARAVFEEVLKQSDDVMLEGRELVLDLRTGAGEISTLSEAFSLAGAELRKAREADFRVLVHGVPRELHPIVYEEAYRVGKEALVNAFQHSGASTIEAELNYGVSGLRLRVRDNGRGIDAQVLSEGRRVNHWGLPGMRERSRKIGAQLDIWSGKGAGTEIELSVPEAVAYRAHQASPRFRWLNHSVSKGDQSL